MRVIKLLLGVGLLAGLALMWTNRDFVVDSYTSGGETRTDLRLDGVNLNVELSPIEDSPYEVLEAPDTRQVPVVLAFDDNIVLPGGQEASDPTDADDADDGVGELGDEVSVTTSTARPTVTSPPPPMYGGTARLEGVVMGPQGAASYATVRLERHTSEGMAVKDVTADARGRWSVSHLLGGRYRVRAWVPGRLTMTESQVFFLDHEARRLVDLDLGRVLTEPRVSLSDAGDIFVGLTGSVAVSVTTETVDSDGLVVVSGIPGTIVSLHPSHGVTVTPTVGVADRDGVARFTLRCDEPGAKAAIVQYQSSTPFQPTVAGEPTYQEDSQTFELPFCAPPPPPEVDEQAPGATTPDGQPVETTPQAPAPTTPSTPADAGSAPTAPVNQSGEGRGGNDG